MRERERVRQEYDKVRQLFEGISFSKFKEGEWLTDLVSRVLREHAQTVNADYIRRTYPGAGPHNQSRRAIKIAARQAGIAGGLSAATITSAQAVTVTGGGVPAPVTVPMVGTAIMADVVYVTRTQLRCAYDLSAIYGAPLSVDDVEDCQLLLMAAAGVKLGEVTGEATKSVAPKVIAYNMRKILRRGLRSWLQRGIQRIGGSQLARKLTERAMIRLAVPAASIPLASGYNYLFTKLILQRAHRHMQRRGQVVGPVYGFSRSAPTGDPTVPVKGFISIIASSAGEYWSEEQMDALRHIQSVAKLDDEALQELDGWFDQDVHAFCEIANGLPPAAVDDLIELCALGAALARDTASDASSASWLCTLSGQASEELSVSESQERIVAAREALMW